MPEQTPQYGTPGARYVAATLPGSPHEDYLICVAQTAVIAIMATILKSADNGTGHKETDEVAVGQARKLYHETIRQMWGPTTKDMTTPLGSNPPTSPSIPWKGENDINIGR